MTRVLTIVCNLNIGGTQRVAVNYAIALKKKGMDSRLVAIQGGGPRFDSLVAAGVTTWTLRGDEKVMDLKMMFGEWMPDIIHVHSHNIKAVTFGNVLNAFPKRPFVVETSVFSSPAPYDDEVDLTLELSTWACWLGLLRRIWRNPGRTHRVIPNSVDTPAFHRLPEDDRQSIRNRLGLPVGAKVIGRIGQPIAAKWHPGMFDVFERLALTDAQLYCVVVGLPIELERRIKQMPEDVQRRVMKLPVVSTDRELCELYNVFDVFVHWAEIGESFGVVLCEAMLCEVPIVSMATPYADNSQGEVIGENIGGFIVGSKKQMCERVQQLLINTDCKSVYGKNGRQRVQEKFATDVVIEKICSLYIKTTSNSFNLNWACNGLSIINESVYFGVSLLRRSSCSLWYIGMALHIVLRPVFVLLRFPGWYTIGRKIHKMAVG